MLAWVVIFSSHSRRATLCRHVTKIPSPQLLLFPGLTNGDACNSFRIRSYANCRVAYARVLLSSIFRTLFQVLYLATPFFATLTKTTGVCTNNSHSGTQQRAGLTSKPSFFLGSRITGHELSLSSLSTFNFQLSTSSVPFFRESQVTDYESQFPASSILCVAI